ncbi:MAG: hypothetical protein ACFKPT_17525 [Gloeotrichia echinulata GP01]
MAVARKSAVSTTSNWFRGDSPLSLGKRRSARLRSGSTLAAEPSAVPPRRQRYSSKNLSVSATNGAVLPTSTPDLSKKPGAKLKGQSTTAEKNQRLGFPRLPVMPSSEASPLWLLRLYTLHRYSSVVAFLLVAATLMVYGWTVYSQELWSQGYRRLQNLQRHERQLTTTNATLTNKMANEAEQPAAGLVSPTPGKTIFLPPASGSPDSTPPSTIPNSPSQESTSSSLGY